MRSTQKPSLNQALFLNSALPLLMFWVLTNYPDAAFSFDDFAFLANRFY